MAEVCIISRRGDAGPIAGHIINYLTQTFGTDDVTGNHIPIDAGQDARDVLSRRVSNAYLVLVIIGRSFFTDNRLTSPTDPVRFAVDAALRRNQMIVPLLVDGAVMPPPHELPVGLDALAYRGAVPVRDVPDFQRDMESVTYTVRQAVSAGKQHVAPAPHSAPAYPPQPAPVYHQQQPVTPVRSASGSGAAGAALRVATAPARATGRGCGWLLTHILAPMIATTLGRVVSAVFGLIFSGISLLFTYSLVQNGFDVSAAVDATLIQIADIFELIRTFIETQLGGT